MVVMGIVAQTDLEVPRGQSALLGCCSEHPCWHLLGCFWLLPAHGVKRCFLNPVLSENEQMKAFIHHNRATFFLLSYSLLCFAFL